MAGASAILTGMIAFKRQSGFSRVEVICLCGLAVVALAIALSVGFGAWHDWRQGNDSVTLNTAESCGNIGATDACLVPGCPGKGTAHRAHLDVHGNDFAYFDKVGNCLVGELPAGYNEDSVETADGRSFEAGTAVVVVTRNGSGVTVDWILGR